MGSLIAFLVLAAAGWRVMSKDQRLKILRTIDLGLVLIRDHGREELARFTTARRARMRWAVVTVALAALSVAIFLWAPQGSGASFGPLTSNGQWWRLLTSLFVTRGVLLLLVNLVALVQVGLILERLVGGAAFGAVFVAAGIFSGLAGLSTHPMQEIAGPAGAVWGLYGMLLVVSVALWRRQSELRLPLAAIERLGIVAVIFAFANLLDRGSGGAIQLVGLSAGIVLGLASARDVASRATPTKRAAAVFGIAAVVAVLCAVPLRGILDVRPEIARIVDVEHTTTAKYVAANDQFRKGRMTADSLAAVIEQTIVPDLQAALDRLDTLRGVPAEDAPRVAQAREFLRMRSESWRLREQALRLTARSVKSAAKSDGDSDATFRQRAQEQYTASLFALGKADGAERTSLTAFEHLQEPPPALAR